MLQTTQPTNGSVPEAIALLAGDVEPQAQVCYARALRALQASRIPFLVGGAFALTYYAGILRRTKDLDLFVRRRDAHTALSVLEAEGYETCLPYPHWLGKAISGEDFIDIIFSSGNGLAEVDEDWFTYAVPSEVFGVTVDLCPAEEIVWAKSFIMERERYDGADVAHLLRAQGDNLDWPRLLARFGEHYRVLLSQIILFGFIYPAEKERVPSWVLEDLLARLANEARSPASDDKICRGTLLSRAQYLVDIERAGYEDARLSGGSMTPEDIAMWTRAIDTSKSRI
jgi:putative nucleotidyltransferase-like protein